jgi:hypothetical protein
MTIDVVIFTPCDGAREADACEVVSWKKGQFDQLNGTKKQA